MSKCMSLVNRCKASPFTETPNNVVLIGFMIIIKLVLFCNHNFTANKKKFELEKLHFYHEVLHIDMKLSI